MKITRWIKAGCVGLVCTCLLSLCGFSAQCEDIADRVVRLHILANSDSEADQALKLKVRDAILEETAGMLDGVLSTALAREELAKALPAIEAAAKRTLLANGSDDAVTVELCEMYFTTRQYDTLTMPAGVYDALRVTIGEGKGHNWWCVVFPPLCLSGAGQTLDGVLTDEETDIVTAPSGYEVRFKLVEWVEGIRNWLQ